MPASTPPSKVAAIILAAGMSKRMGAPKQLLRLGGATLLEHALNNVRQSQAGEIILVLGHAADAIRGQTALEGVKIVINPAFAEGMGTSLRTGIAAVSPESNAALIVLADQPFVRPETLDRLIEQHHAHHPQIVIPVYRGFRGNPILLDRSVFPELAGLAGDIGCRAIFGDHTENILKIETHDPGILLDIDTEADLKKPEAKGAGEKPVVELCAGPAPSEDSPELVIVGREKFAHALAAMARLLGFTVTVADPLLAPEEFPEAHRILHVLDFSKLPANAVRHVVIASRGQFDEEAIEQAVSVGARYIALVANKKRGEEIKRTLRSRGIPTEKLRVPAGLQIGAESQEEIALSIMAEIVVERAG